MSDGTIRLSSNKTKQLLLLGGLSLVGAIQIVAFAALHGGGDATVGAGLMLGVIVVGVAAFGVVLGRQRSVTIDRAQRTLCVEDKTRLGVKRRVIPFGDVRAVELDVSGDDEGGSRAFDVVVTLRSGEHVHLFASAFFDDRHDRVAMERTRGRLEDALGLARG